MAKQEIWTADDETNFCKEYDREYARVDVGNRLVYFTYFLQYLTIAPPSTLGPKARRYYDRKVVESAARIHAAAVAE